MRLFSCKSCNERDREIARLRQENSELKRDNNELKQENGQVKRENGQLKHENLRLREELATARRETNRQAAPFRRDKLKKRKKKPGRRKGHAPAHRPPPPPERIDRVVEVSCHTCPDCSVPLVDPGVVIQYQTDLPPIVPIVTQFNIETGFCPCCRQRQRGRHPDQASDAIGAAGNTLGPVVLTMAAELKHRLGVSYRKICDFFRTYCQLSVSPGTLVRAEQRLADLAQPTYDLLLDALRQSDVVHADETGWRVNSVNAWLWVFSNANVTIYAIRTGEGARGHGVPAEILGPDFDGFLVVDGFSSYNVLDYKKGQCNAHLLRRCKKERETARPAEQAHLDRLIKLLQDAIALAERRPTVSAANYQRQTGQMEDRLIDWLSTIPANPSDNMTRLFKHVQKHVEEWLVFLFHPEVPPTNNHAERMLRPAVITRKVGGCNKTLLGALVHSVLSSIMVTCKQRGHQFLDVARQLWQGRQPQAIPIPIAAPRDM
jgi:transposase